MPSPSQKNRIPGSNAANVSDLVVEPTLSGDARVAEPAASVVEVAPAPAVDLDAPLPGEVFVRACPRCGKLKQTADQTGKTACRRCLAGLPPEPVVEPGPTPAVGQERADGVSIGENRVDVAPGIVAPVDPDGGRSEG